MKRIKPETINNILLPCAIYPFVSGADDHAYQRARVTLKLACLLHDKLTIPGSLALENIFIRNLLIENEDFLKKGIVILDLRDTCNSFYDLAQEKHGSYASVELLKVAEKLDSICEQTLLFHSGDTENEFKIQMRRYLCALHKRSRTNNVKNVLEKSIQSIDDLKTPFTYDIASSLVNKTYLAKRTTKIAKLLYSTVGAKVTNSSPLLPVDIWEAGNLSNRTIERIDYSVNDRRIADAAVMEYFFIRADAIDSLSALDIIEIRSEPNTKKYISELDLAISESTKSIENDGEIHNDLNSFIISREEMIRKRIYNACQKEQNKKSTEGKVLHVVEEGAGYFVPFISTAKKGAAALARTAAKKSAKLSWLDYTTTPIATHVSRYQSTILDRRGIKLSP